MVSDAVQRAILKFNYDISLLRLDLDELIKKRESFLTDEYLKQVPQAYAYQVAMNDAKISALEIEILRHQIEVNYLLCKDVAS